MKGVSRAGCADIYRANTANAVKHAALGSAAFGKPTHYGVDINDPWRERHNAKKRVITRRKGSLHSEYN